ncbi:PDDEXK nuclease domain-containing protein [Duncaniella dubosii]|uniref:PDDEXK nuclease domain-containing protein n=1 Tax=Duncaniella dubosii TaxID=2518971 RepID=UPI003F663B61
MIRKTGINFCGIDRGRVFGLSQDAAYSETNLESAIIDHLQKFILELGKGFAFVVRVSRG